MNKLYILLILTVFTACSPKVLITNINKNKAVEGDRNCSYIYGKNEILLDSTITIADFQTKGHFFTAAKYRVNKSLELVKNENFEFEYNAIQIENIEFPGPFKSKSYDISGKLLMTKECPTPKSRLVNQMNSKDKNYIVVYRKNRVFGSGISFPIFFNEHFMCGLNNDSKIIIELSEEENDKELQIESYGERFIFPIEFNQQNVVYVRCVVNQIGRPEIVIENQEKAP